MKKFDINLNGILRNLTEWLDISETYFERAESRYQAIGDWLSRPESTVLTYEPDVFSQGSFSLGTVIKPVTNEDDYDIDLVCKLHAKKSDISQKQLKYLVGQELKNYVAARRMSSPATERRRCWRLDYADQDVHFHLDVLPAIPDSDSLQDETIAITDNQEPEYSIVNEEWPYSNPVDYLSWFQQRMEVQWKVRRKELAEAYKANVDDVPKYKIKTPLQRVIQLLKRHRDITYDGEPDDKPISILITTLAARAYEEESDIVEALQNVVMKMRDCIEDREGVYWVANPVDSTENFADKWTKYQKRQEAFFNWLDRIEMDTASLFEATTTKSFKETLRSGFGENAANAATKDLTNTQLIESLKSSIAIRYDPSKFVVAHKEKADWDMRLDKTVHVTVAKRRDGFRYKKIPNGAGVQKEYSLRFMAYTNTRKPYEVHWQVVNTGKEAREAQQLRGKFYKGFIQKGRRVRTESTMYQGMHWVECFIVKRGVCVARSGEFVINII